MDGVIRRAGALSIREVNNAAILWIDRDGNIASHEPLLTKIGQVLVAEWNVDSRNYDSAGKTVTRIGQVSERTIIDAPAALGRKFVIPNHYDCGIQNLRCG